jgi:hypothetical protein
MIFHFANELGDICVKYITDFIQSQKHTEPVAIEPVQSQQIQSSEEEKENTIGKAPTMLMRKTNNQKDIKNTATETMISKRVP